MGNQNAKIHIILATVTLMGWGLAFGPQVDGSGTTPPKSSNSHDTDLLEGLWKSGAEMAGVYSRNETDFEGGNIGAIKRLGPYDFSIQLRSDNDDALPEFWRRWWSLVLDVPTDRPVTLTITGAGQWAYYLPLFSYEGSDRNLRDDAWEHLPESAVDQPDPLTLRIRYQFRKSPVAIARFVPYTLTRMLMFLKKISHHEAVSLHVAGFSPEGRPMPVIRVGQGKLINKKIFIHSRTHPGEIGSSFLLEGFLLKLLGPGAEMRRIREDVTFDIMPILNVDGVYHGNNRVTPSGINLEGKWYPIKSAPSGSRSLDPAKTPREVMVWHRWILNSLKDGGLPVIALNLHSSSVEPHEGLFSFPHFGPREAGYSPKEARLYENQVKFMEFFQKSMKNKRWFLPIPKDGFRFFTAKNLPETWWWTHFGDQVMALTIESTYGKIPSGGRWMRPEDLRGLGSAMAQGIAQFIQTLPSQPGVAGNQSIGALPIETR